MSLTKHSLPLSPRNTPPPAPEPTRTRSRVWMGLGLLTVVLALVVAGMMFIQPANALEPPRKFSPADIRLMDGYRIEAALSNLDMPTAAVFDGRDLIIAESAPQATRILRIKSNGDISILVNHGLHSPITGLAVQNGRLYVSHKSKVSVVDGNGRLTDIVTGLPSDGDNQNNNVAVGADGRIYLGQGTVTNAGVIGLDNFALGWLNQNPELHDVPCQDVVLLGQNYQTVEPSSTSQMPRLTGAYEKYGVPSTPDEKVKGELRCGGAILSFNGDGTDLAVIAWGLRNPYGLAFKADQLWATDQGPQLRGSRLIANAPDSLIQVQHGAWYGWPDYFGGQPVTDDRFKAPGKPEPGFLLDKDPPLTKSFLTFTPQSTPSGLAFSPGGDFGSQGDAFVAMLGPLALEALRAPAGYGIVRVNTQTAAVEDFALNAVPGPAYENGQAGLDRPVSVLFGPDASLYVLDMGVAKMTTEGVRSDLHTGALWRIYSSKQQALYSNGPRAVQPPAPTPAADAGLDTSDYVATLLMQAVMSAPVIVLVAGGLLVAGFVMLVTWRFIRERYFSGGSNEGDD